MLGFSICAYMCICMRMYMCVHVCVYSACVYVCICIYVCLCICMHIHLFIYARVWVYICTREGTFCLFVLSNLSATCACITGVSEHLHAWVWGDWTWGFFQLFMINACCWCGRLCFGRGRHRGFVSYISLFLWVLGWWVYVCLYKRVHIHKVLGYLL